ncbi:MAG: hypothetical protein ABIV63_21205 [Caldimonas sp.]
MFPLSSTDRIEASEGKLSHRSFDVVHMASAHEQSDSRHLYIAHLATRLDAIESGTGRLNPVIYRLWSRRLREAMAGHAEPTLAKSMARLHPSVAHALEQRFFNMHGVLPGAAGQAARLVADALFCRLTLPLH